MESITLSMRPTGWFSRRDGDAAAVVPPELEKRNWAQRFYPTIAEVSP